MFNQIEELWARARLLKESFEEYRLCSKEVYSKAQELIRCPEDISKEFQVSCLPMPEEFFYLKKNLFSALFQSVYRILGIKEERRCLYGKLNHLFRIWVTSADNLLDGEDKITLPLKIPGESRIMRQVISIMAADRIMKRILDEAVEEKVITIEESKILADKSLRILLPSAAEEASEEGGILQRPDPDYVLNTIHKLKTGLLFHIPFLGPESIESGIDQDRLSGCKEGLGRFGLGCQLLDDIRDMARDYLEKRHNYVLSCIFWQGRSGDIDLLKDLEKDMRVQDKISPFFNQVVLPAAELAGDLLKDGLFILDKLGLGLGESAAKNMARSMFKILDVGELTKCKLQAAALTMPPAFMTA